MRQHLERRLEVLGREIAAARKPRLKISTLDLNLFEERRFDQAVPARTPGKSTLRETIETKRKEIEKALAHTAEHAGFKTGDRVVIVGDCWCTGLTATLTILDGQRCFHVRTEFDQNEAWRAADERTPGRSTTYCLWELCDLGTKIKHLKEKASPPPILPNGTRIRMTAKCVEVCIPKGLVGKTATITKHRCYWETEDRHSYEIQVEDDPDVGRVWLCGEPHFEVLAAEKRPFAVGQRVRVIATPYMMKRICLEGLEAGTELIVRSTDARLSDVTFDGLECPIECKLQENRCASVRFPVEGYIEVIE